MISGSIVALVTPMHPDSLESSFTLGIISDLSTFISNALRNSVELLGMVLCKVLPSYINTSPGFASNCCPSFINL